jgi:hypothetical protein
MHVNKDRTDELILLSKTTGDLDLLVILNENV